MASRNQESTTNPRPILGGEILLYNNPENINPIWYYRFKNPTKQTQYIRKSAKTQSFALATKIAIDHYNDIQSRFRSGSEFHETTWDLIFSKFISKIDGKRSQELANQYNEKYWSKFFGSSKKSGLKDLFDISDSTLESYWAWRVRFYDFETSPFKDSIKKKWDGTKPRKASKVKGKSSHATLRTEAYLLKFFLYEAYRVNMLSMMPKVILKWDKFKNYTYKLPQNNRRGRFDDESIAVIQNWWRQTRMKLAKTRFKKLEVNETKSNWKTEKDERIIFNKPDNRYSIAMTYMLTVTIANTGIRPVEITQLKWEDINKFEDEDGNSYSFINIREEVAKTKKRRDAVSRDFEETWNRFQEWKIEWEKYWGREPTNNDLVFPHIRANKYELSSKFVKTSKVKPHQSIRNLFLKLSKQTGKEIYKQDVNGVLVPRTLYSFRSYFITKRLENGMDAYTLARTCGTSIEMIERYYDVNANLRFRKEITKHIKNFEHRGDSEKQY